MKRKVITLLLIFLVIITATLVGIKVSYAWESSSIDKNAINVTIQSNYIENESTMAVTLKSSNVYGKKDNELTKNELIEAVKGKYGVNIIKNVYKADGVTSIENTECVGTGYKVQLVTNKMLTVILYGDVNCNGVIDTDDTVAIAKHNVNILQLNKYQEIAAHLTVKKNAKDPVIDIDDTVRVAFYNVNGLGTGHAGETIVDTALYPADEQFESGAEVENINNTDDTYKTALSTFTKNEFTKNNDELKLKDGKLEGTVNYNFAVENDVFPEDELTGYYFGYVIKAQGANENTTLKIKNNDKEIKEIPYVSFDTTEGISMIASLSKTATNKKIEIEVDLDGAGTLYKPYTKIIDYTNLQFGDIVSATISYNIPKSEAEKLEGADWNYRFEFSHSHAEDEGYAITKESKNKYKVTGIVTEQDQVNGFSGSAKTDYYLAFAIEPSYVNDDIKIKIPSGDGKYNTVGKSALVEDKLTTIISISEGENESFKIFVDLDGDGDRFEEEEITIDYSDLKFEKSSQFEIKKELPEKNGDNGNAIKEKLNALGFKPENYFSLIGGTDDLEITVDELNKQLYTVKGTIPKMNEVHAGFDDEENGGYYIVFTVKMENSGNKGGDTINEKVKITLTSPSDEENAKVRVLDHESFDTATEMAVLWKLDEKRSNKTFKVTIDLDGDEDEYAPYHVVFDYSDVVFQQETTAKISIDETKISEADKEDFDDWGYKLQSEIKLSQENKHLVDNEDEIKYDDKTGLLSGIIKEQKLTSGYNPDELDSYFYTFIIEPEEVTEDIKVTVKSGENKERTFNYDDFTDNKLTVLQRIPLDNEKCTDPECCNTTGDCKDAEKCKKAIQITIDTDGDGKYGYKPSKTYYMDFCNLDFVKLHTVSFKNADETDVKLANGNVISSVELYDGEKVTEPETPVKENGLDEQKYNTFSYWRESGTREYGGDYSKKFEFGKDKKSTEVITEDLTLNPMWEIDVDQYITDAISTINGKEETNNDFEIEKTEGAIRVEIKDRDQNIDSIEETGIAETIAHALMSDTIKEIDVELKEISSTLSVTAVQGNTLKLNRKEIKDELNDSFTEEAVKSKVIKDIKDYLKGENLSTDGDSLDNLFTTCSGKELELTIEPEESIANIKDKDNKASAVYHITFEKELMITFDAGVLGNLDTQYEKNGTTVTDLPTPTIPELEQPYRAFDGWYKKGQNEKITKIEDIKEDTELEAHYKLNVEKFMEDVINDLNNPDSTYSDDFTGQFELTQDESKKNEITIQVQSPNVKLSQLSETSIPGTIAYILQKGEIQDVTLTVGDSTTKTFKKDAVAGISAVGAQANGDSGLDEAGEALKQKVITDAKEAFNTELTKKDGTEEDATMDQVEFEGTTFTLKIGNATDSTIKLVDDNGADLAGGKDTYTFKFNSDFAVVKKGDKLGPDTINQALDKKSYKEIYVGGDTTEDKTITISADVTIKPLEDVLAEKVGLMTVAEDPKHTITVSGQNFGIDVTEGNVTISDLKITGAKYGQLRVGTDATVDASNLDVSGDIEASKKSNSDEMHAAIVVDGKLTANNIKNSDEKYSTPTIALVTDFSYPGSDVTGEEKESANKNLHPDAEVEVTSSDMTRNDKYHITKSEVAEGFDQIEETYYGSFYYVNSDNSQIYFMSIIDRVIKNTGGITFFKIYHYDDTIDIEKLGYTDKLEKEGKKFQKLTVDETKKDITVGNKPKAQEVLRPHYSNNVKATYVTASMILQSNELEVTGNKLSGVLSNKNEKGKYCIPVTLSSEHFIDGKSTVKVTNPNNVTETYTYKSNNPSGIALASAVSTMQIELEAIKSSNITGKNGKVYTIAVDVDGDETQYNEDVYTVDYNQVKTLEEKINNAAENTKNANNITIKKNNNINGLIEKFDYMYDNEKDLVYTKSTNGDNVEEYIFSNRYAGVKDSELSAVARKVTGAHEEGKVYINNWEYIHQLKVGRAIQELTMLTDVMKNSHVYNAIDGVKAVDGKDHTYIVTLNRDKYNHWVDDSYLSNPDYTIKEFTPDNKLEVQVELDDEEEYIKSIKTTEEHAINKFDVTFENINTTNIKEPKEFFAEGGKELTEKDIKEFYEKGKAWWESNKK